MQKYTTFKQSPDVNCSTIKSVKPAMRLNEKQICSGLLWTCGWLGRHCLDYNFPPCFRRPFQPRCPFLHSYPDLDADHTIILVQTTIFFSCFVGLCSDSSHFPGARNSSGDLKRFINMIQSDGLKGPKNSSPLSALILYVC